MDTPNTVNYMMAGYAVLFSLLTIYVASLVWRINGLKNIMKRELKNTHPVNNDEVGKD
jgi:hypothetical protein